MAVYNVSVTETLSLSDSVSARLVTDEQYAAWLKADNKERCVLVEAEVASQSTGWSDTTRYFSNVGYTSVSSDSPASTAYEDILLRVPEIRWSMGELLRGRSLITYGDIEIDNSSGARDSWLDDAWDNRPVRIYLGDKSWHKQDFRQVFAGLTQDIRALDTSTLALRIRDKQWMLHKNLSTTLISTGPAVQRRSPVCYGQCKNVEPVMVDTTNAVYQVHDGPIEDVTAFYIGGVAQTRGVGYEATAGQLAAGQVRSLASVTGRVTCDVKGAKVSSVYYDKTGAIIKRILLDRAGFTADEIDSTSLDRLDSLFPYSVGYFDNGEDTTIVEALDKLMESLAGYFAIDRSGKFYAAEFEAPVPGDTAVVSLDDDDIEEGSLEVIRRIVPPKSVRVGYNGYFTIDKYPASTVSRTDRTRLQFRHEVMRILVTGGAQFRSSDEGPIEESLFVSSTNADTESGRRRDFRESLHFVYRFRAFLAAQSVKIGDIVALSFSRYGLTNETKVRVVGIRESMTGGWVELEVYR